MSAQSMLSSNASDSHGWEDPYIGCRVMPIKAEKFESYREIIEKLYVTERRPLEDVRRIMALEHNFYANNAQYKKRMRIWKMVKNIPKETMKPILQAQIRREAIHKQTTVRINGKVISDVKLKRGRRTSRFGKELAQQNPSSPINLPSGVEIVSPPPSPTCHTPTNRDPPGHSHRLEIDKFEVFMTELRQHHGRRPMVSILHKDEELTPADQGDTSLYRKQFKKAFAYYCRALSQCPISSTSNIDSSMLPTISNIGLASFENGEDQCALMFYYRALEGYERIGSRRDIVIVLCRIGDVLYALENSDDAREYYSRAVALYDKMPDIDDIECGEITIVVPKALARLGYYTKAWDIWMRVLSTHKQNNNIIGSSNILNEIALYYHMNKREFKLALELHLRALEGYRSGGGWFAEAGITLDYMGLAFEELGQSENALEHHLQALYIFGNAKSNGYCIQRAKSYARMGDVHRRHANYAEALQNQYSALVEYEKTCSSGNTLREGCIRDIESLFLDLRQQEDHTQIYQNLLDKFQNALGSQHKMIVMAREERDASSARVAINTSYPKSTSLLIPGWDVDCFSRA